VIRSVHSWAIRRNLASRASNKSDAAERDPASALAHEKSTGVAVTNNDRKTCRGRKRANQTRGPINDNESVGGSSYWRCVCTFWCAKGSPRRAIRH
jgi:hypothetical protein